MSHGDPGRHRDRLVLELASGHAEDPDPVSQEHLVAFAIALEREPMAVRAPAVEFHDQALRRPVGVDLVENRSQLPLSHDVAVQRLLERVLDLAGRFGGGEVADRPRYRG